MMSTASRQCAIEGFGLMAVSSIVEMVRQWRGVRGLDGRRASSGIQNGLAILCPLSGVPKLFRFGADFGETIRETAEAGSASAARQCPAEHLQNVLCTQEGIDYAVEAGSKTRRWRLRLGTRTECPRHRW